MNAGPNTVFWNHFLFPPCLFKLRIDTKLKGRVALYMFLLGGTLGILLKLTVGNGSSCRWPPISEAASALITLQCASRRQSSDAEIDGRGSPTHYCFCSVINHLCIDVYVRKEYLVIFLPWRVKFTLKKPRNLAFVLDSWGGTLLPQTFAVMR